MADAWENQLITSPRARDENALYYAPPIRPFWQSIQILLVAFVQVFLEQKKFVNARMVDGHGVYNIA